MNTLSTNRTFQLLSLHATAVVIVLVGGAFFVAGWVPPPPPNEGLDAIAASFQDHTAVRIAGAMFLFGGAFYVGPAPAYAVQMRRIEGANHTLADIQLLSAAIGVVALQVPGVLWLAISYYPNMEPSVIATLNAVAWFLILGAVAPLMLQEACLAACIFRGDGEIYPPWLGYACLWCATLAIPGIFMPFVKTGPIAWNGLLGFWVVAAAFFTWVILMWTCTYKAIRSQPSGPEPAPSPC